jgi:ABC-type Mn2+/Zn2+ transport system ATPase subunit
MHLRNTKNEICLAAFSSRSLKETMTSTADLDYAHAVPIVLGQPPAIEVHGLYVSYGAQPVLEDISFNLPPGQLVGIIGPNGAGKTTLLKALLGLIPRASGSVAVAGTATRRRGGPIAYVPQRDAINWRFPATVADVVLMGRYGRLGWLQRPGAHDRAIAQRCIEEVGMAGFADRPIAQLSGGQQQRVFLARALAQEPEVLLLDEPISGVDAPTQEAILAILAGLAAQGKTLLITTHDLRCNMEYFDALLALNRSLVALGPVAQVLTPAVLTRTYGTQVVLADGTSVALT